MKYALFAPFLLIASLHVQADAFNPQQFVEENCSACHGSEVYTRDTRKMQGIQQLAAQVRRCDAQVGTALFDEDMDAVISYLNETYYKF